MLTLQFLDVLALQVINNYGLGTFAAPPPSTLQTLFLRAPF